MIDREWPRSRFWLCHFLYSRHERPAITWDAPTDSPNQATELDRTAADFLAWQIRIDEAGRKKLIEQAAEQCANDPAYIQSLRLFVREEQHHQAIAQRWLATQPSTPPQTDAVRSALRTATRPLGIRFELSLLLIGELVTLTLNRMLCEKVTDPTLAGVLGQIIADHELHIAFHSERLTAEFADFNFLRRNLRRWRLRGMHASLVKGVAWRHRSLLKMLDVSANSFREAATDNFETVLSRMVPYRRAALLEALGQQREQRYEKPSRV